MLWDAAYSQEQHRPNPIYPLLLANLKAVVPCRSSRSNVQTAHIEHPLVERLLQALGAKSEASMTKPLLDASASALGRGLSLTDGQPSGEAPLRLPPSRSGELDLSPHTPASGAGTLRTLSSEAQSKPGPTGAEVVAPEGENTVDPEAAGDAS